MSSLFLKIIAMITMLIDHVGDVFFGNYDFLRTIGRIAFPLYALMSVEACIYMVKKKDGAKKYLLFLLVIALLSEYGYDKAFYGIFPYSGSQNQVLQFLTFAVAYGITEAIHKSWFSVIVWIITIGINAHFMMGYNGVGIVFMLMLLYYCKNMQKKDSVVRACFLFASLTVLFAGIYFEFYYPVYGFRSLLLIWQNMIYDGINLGVYLALPFMVDYNFTYGNIPKPLRFFYRIFYPLHLTILAILRMIL